MANPTVPKRQLGRALRELREAAVKSREDVAKALECSASKISRIENGHVGVRSTEFAALLDLYDVPLDQRKDLSALARETRKRRPRTTYGRSIPDWFRRFVSLEESASEIRTYNGELVPGLLQTEDYTRAVTEANPLHAPTDIERLVRARAARQARLVGDNPPRLWVVMSEGPLRLQVGGRDVMASQLEHIVEMAKLDHVTVQVAPFAAGAHASTGLNFTLLQFPDDIGVDVVYLEDLTSASYLDKRDDPQRQSYVLVWQHLTASALSPRDTIRLVNTVRRELRQN
ncbi:MAG TPA: helix-turn-helix transcriptional regulator [Actinophytocola sp.]|uniref:helix-turn-helix domain-containing protein n=1 Tax=Actinophytocola sp. TaxID=1872138 RepID=UPI002DBC5B38|nr:helix-turn-helix transcriptional regulator [Actinophytocola sp.]HEU5469985.1 helix-turn-helix transcriptional regulator [Actinophytocola sp.]